MRLPHHFRMVGRTVSLTRVAWSHSQRRRIQELGKYAADRQAHQNRRLVRPLMDNINHRLSLRPEAQTCSIWCYLNAREKVHSAAFEGLVSLVASARGQFAQRPLAAGDEDAVIHLSDCRDKRIERAPRPTSSGAFRHETASNDCSSLGDCENTSAKPLLSSFCTRKATLRARGAFPGGGCHRTRGDGSVDQGQARGQWAVSLKEAVEGAKNSAINRFRLSA